AHTPSPRRSPPQYSSVGAYPFRACPRPPDMRQTRSFLAKKNRKVASAFGAPGGGDMFMCNMPHCCWHTSVLPLSTGCVPRYGGREGDGKAARSSAFPQLTNHCSTNNKVRFSGGDPMSRRQVITGAAAFAFGAWAVTGAFAQETVKIGFI